MSGRSTRRPLNPLGRNTTLWLFNIAIENDHWNSGFAHWKWWFSIAMLVYQRVDVRKPLWTPKKTPFGFEKMHQFIPCFILTVYYLVGGIPTPLKIRRSSVGMMTFPIYGKYWKVIKFMFQTTNQLLSSLFKNKNRNKLWQIWRTGMMNSLWLMVHSACSVVKRLNPRFVGTQSYPITLSNKTYRFFTSFQQAAPSHLTMPTDRWHRANHRREHHRGWSRPSIAPSRAGSRDPRRSSWSRGSVHQGRCSTDEKQCPHVSTGNVHPLSSASIIYSNWVSLELGSFPKICSSWSLFFHSKNSPHEFYSQKVEDWPTKLAIQPSWTCGVNVDSGQVIMLCTSR